MDISAAVLATQRPYRLMVLGRIQIVCALIMENFDTPYIQAVLDWKEDRDVAYQNYEMLIHRVWCQYTSWESGCSMARLECLQVVSDFIVMYAKIHKRKLLAEKKGELSRLLLETAELEMGLERMED